MKKFLKKTNLSTVRNYHEIKKPDTTKPIPWRYVQIPKDEKNPNIQVAVYNHWKAILPPNPILMIHGLTGNHREFSNLIRSCNYPYGVISMVRKKK
jgi:pimeloyl-ACP methyl ester carboxylesterase